MTEKKQTTLKEKPAATKTKTASAPRPKKAAVAKTARVRNRLFDGRTGKKGQEAVWVYVPKESLARITKGKELGTSLGAFARNVWAERTGSSAETAPEGALIGRLVLFPAGSGAEITKFESNGGNLDALVWAAIARKLK